MVSNFYLIFIVIVIAVFVLLTLTLKAIGTSIISKVMTRQRDL